MSMKIAEDIICYSESKIEDRRMIYAALISSHQSEALDGLAGFLQSSMLLLSRRIRARHLTF